MKTRLLLIAVFALTLLSCNLTSALSPTAQPTPTNPTPTPPSIPQSWIDFPAAGEEIPMAPYQVIFHGSDPAGVVQVEFSVNGIVEVIQSIEKNTMPVGKRSWTPPVPGAYTIGVRMQNSAGMWGEVASVSFSVLEPTPTPPLPTDAPLEAPTPEPTSTAGLVQPTETTTPVPLSFTSSVSPLEGVFGGSCSPTELTFKVTVSDPEQVFSVVLFTRMKDASGGSLTPWVSVKSMKPSGDHSAFTLKINVTSLPAYDTYAQSIVYYQYVATDKSNQVIGRSLTYSDLVIEECVEIVEP